MTCLGALTNRSLSVSLRLIQKYGGDGVDGSERLLVDLRIKTPLSFAFLEISKDVSMGHPTEATFSKIVATSQRTTTVLEPRPDQGEPFSLKMERLIFLPAEFCVVKKGSNS
uniref:Uncharacterized protein n=1 Tax=Romanomermis culicivorax TaxID=13658 RepID=A0A915JSY5_ROMCU